MAGVAACREDLYAGLEIESKVQFPSPAFGQVECLVDSFGQIRFRDRNLQAQGFNGRAVQGAILGFIGLLLCLHGS